jgi:hypothetical protein
LPFSPRTENPELKTKTEETENHPMNENQWTVYRTRFLVRARQLTQPMVFTDALGREQSGRPGDYLVESSDGIRRITTQAIFEDIYVALSNNLQTENNNNDGANHGTNDGAPGALPRPHLSQSSRENRHRAIA